VTKTKKINIGVGLAVRNVARSRSLGMVVGRTGQLGTGADHEFVCEVHRQARAGATQLIGAVS